MITIYIFHVLLEYQVEVKDSVFSASSDVYLFNL